MAIVISGTKYNNTNRMTISNMVILGGRAGYSLPTLVRVRLDRNL